MYYSNIGPHVRGLGGKILMYEGGFDYHYRTEQIIRNNNNCQGNNINAIFNSAFFSTKVKKVSIFQFQERVAIH